MIVPPYKKPFTTVFCVEVSSKEHLCSVHLRIPALETEMLSEFTVVVVPDVM